MLQTREQIGRLDRRVTFQEPVIGSNASNEDQETGWQDVVPVWAQIDDQGRQSGGEEFRADKLTYHMVQTVVIRYREVSSVWRVMINGIPYDILKKEELARKRYVKITCASGLEYQR